MIGAARFLTLESKMNVAEVDQSYREALGYIAILGTILALLTWYSVGKRDSLNAQMDCEIRVADRLEGMDLTHRERLDRIDAECSRSVLEAR